MSDDEFDKAIAAFEGAGTTSRNQAVDDGLTTRPHRKRDVSSTQSLLATLAQPTSTSPVVATTARMMTRKDDAAISEGLLENAGEFFTNGFRDRLFDSKVPSSAAAPIRTTRRLLSWIER